MAEYRGLTIRIGADAGKFTAAMKATSSAVSATQKQLTALKKSLQLDPGNKNLSSLYMKEIQSNAGAASAKVNVLSSEMEYLKSTVSKADGTKTIGKLAEETTNAALAAKRAKEAYANVTEAIAQINVKLSNTQTAKSLDLKINSETAEEDLKAFFDLLVESGEMSAEKVQAIRAQLERLGDVWTEFNAANKDAKMVEALHNDQVAAAQLEAQISSLAAEFVEASRSGNADLFDELDGKISQAALDADSARTKFELLDKALELNPTNVVTASERMSSLKDATAAAREKVVSIEAALRALRGSGVEETVRGTKNLSSAAESAKKAFRDAQKEVMRLEGELDKAEAAAKELKAADKGLDEGYEEAQANVERLKQELEEAKSAAEEAGNEFHRLDDGVKFTNLENELQEAKNNLDTLKQQGKASFEELSMAAFSAMQDIGQYAGQALSSVTDATRNLDEAYANMRKTVDGTESQFTDLYNNAVSASKVQPISADTILNIEALGGQLGFGIDQLEEFSRVASGLDIATNMGWDDASSEMAQFFNIMGTKKEQVSNFGSAIVDLGNNSATTEADISDMALRIASAGASMNLSEADVLGMSAALASMGLTAEAGGSSIAQIMIKIDKAVANGTEGIKDYADQMGMSVSDFANYVKSLDDDSFSNLAKSFDETTKSFKSNTVDSLDALEVWADTANMTVDDFVNKWTTSPIDAITALFSGMGKAAEEGSNLNLLLEDLGITTIRQSDVARRVANAADIMTDSVKRSNSAWRENTALNTEVTKRNESLSARFEILGNNINAIMTEFGEGLSPFVDVGIVAFKGIADALDLIPTGAKSATIAFLGLTAALGTGASLAMTLGPSLTSLYEGLVKSTAISGVIGNLATLKTAVAGGVFELAAAETAVTSLSAVLNPLTIGVGALAAVVAYLGSQAYSTWKQTKNFNSSLENLRDASKKLSGDLTIGTESVRHFSDSAKAMSVDEIADDLNKLADTFSSIIDPVQESNAMLGEYQSIIDKFGGTGRVDLSDGEWAELQWAVDGVNDALGTNYSAIDVLNGRYKDEETEIDNLIGHIDRLIEKKQAEAEADAAKELYTESLKEQMKLERDREVASSNYYDLLSHYLGLYKDLGVTEEDLLNPDKWNLPDLQSAHADLVAVDDALKEVRDDTKDARDRMRDANSALAETDTMLKMLTENFADQDFGWKQALDDMGIGLEDFCDAAVQAGVKTEDLQRIMNDPNVKFADMVRESGGDLDVLIGIIQRYNSEHMEEKKPEVDTSDAEVRIGGLKESINSVSGSEVKLGADSSGAEEGVSKAKASVNDFGNMNPRSPSLNVDNSRVQPSVQLAQGWVNSFYGRSVYLDVDISGIQAKIEKAQAKINALRVGNAAGGLRYHADGMILNRPTWIGNRDIAGEAGAEAIIPLTNRKYVQPFADTVAEGMLAKLGGLSGGTTYNLYLDGLRINDDAAIRQDVLNLLTDLRRRANMNNG